MNKNKRSLWGIVGLVAVMGVIVWMAVLGPGDHDSRDRPPGLPEQTIMGQET